MDWLGFDRRLAPASSRLLFCPRATLRFGLALGMVSLSLAGCANGGRLGPSVDRTLAAVGLKDARAVADQLRTAEIALHGAGSLNAGRDRKGVALVVRIYQLRDAQRFELAQMTQFLGASDRHGLGDDVLDVAERVLLPGETQRWSLRLANDARHVGVVALFRQPGDGPWRFVFDGRRAIRDGIVIGAHACALTSASPALTTAMSGDPMRLSGVRCGH